MQRLLRYTRWDADAVRDDLRAYAVEHLGTEAGVTGPFGQLPAVLPLDTRQQPEHMGASGGRGSTRPKRPAI